MYFVTFWCGKCQTGSVVTVQSQFECGTIKIKFLVFCLRAIKTCFFQILDCHIPDIVFVTGYCYRNINKARIRLEKQVVIASNCPQYPENETRINTVINLKYRF
jgi:hypothetical protein